MSRRLVDVDVLIAYLRELARTAKEGASLTASTRMWQIKAMQWTIQYIIKSLNNGTIPITVEE